jgi:hypothetical protein
MDGGSAPATSAPSEPAAKAGKKAGAAGPKAPPKPKPGKGIAAAAGAEGPGPSGTATGGVTKKKAKGKAAVADPGAAGKPHARMQSTALTSRIHGCLVFPAQHMSKVGHESRDTHGQQRAMGACLHIRIPYPSVQHRRH